MAVVNEIINSKSRLIDCSLAVNVADSMFAPSIGHYDGYLVWGYSQCSACVCGGGGGGMLCANLKTGLPGERWGSCLLCGFLCCLSGSICTRTNISPCIWESHAHYLRSEQLQGWGRNVAPRLLCLPHRTLPGSTPPWSCFAP